MRRLRSLVLLLILFCGAAPMSGQAASAPAQQVSPEAMIQQFVGEDELSPQRRIETKRKHEILFLMGLALLVLLLATGGFGIAMAAFGKEVFVPHMILAGLSLTLAIAHAVTSIVWFWPY